LTMEDLFTNIVIAAADTKKEAPSMFGPQCLMPVAILGIFYALLIRPQRKQQKQHAEMVSHIQSGTRVVAAGMVGTITSVKKNSIILKSADSKVELDRNAIERVIHEDDDDSSEKK
jgi:preprotein translocase subunit YajC